MTLASNIFLDQSPQARETKPKNIKWVGLHQAKNLLPSEGNYQENLITVHWMGENVFKPFVQ